MTIASCARKTASAALLSFLMGSAPAFAVDVSERQIVLSYIASDDFKTYLSYPGASSDYGAEEPEFVSEILVRDSGALAAGMDRVGTTDDKVSAKAVLGRALLLMGDRQRAGTTLNAALAAAAAAGWDDRRANGILRDLAWLADASGEAAWAAGYSQRADGCPMPCAEDALPIFQAEAEEALSSINSALGFDLARTRIDLVHGADLIAFVEATYGPQSREAADAWGWRAISLRQTRPWQALEYYRRSLDIEIATGAGAPVTLDTRRAMAELLLQAGEYRRLAEFSEALVPESLAAARSRTDVLYLPGIATSAARLRARALWHLQHPGARAAFGAAIDTMLEFGDADMARTLLEDLIDARYDAETIRVADALLGAYPGEADALFAKARIAARAGGYDEAAALVGEIASPSPIALFQRAFYLDRAGKTAEAAAIRASVAVGNPEDEFSWGDWDLLSKLIDPRDVGAYEGAAEAARAYLGVADRKIAAGRYADAQWLWQIAYTLAMGGDTVEAFRLMKAAASIASRLSFADANDTDGGSLQLLRRDKFRYLLFVDIAWAAATGAPPDAMSVSSRY